MVNSHSNITVLSVADVLCSVGFQNLGDIGPQLFVLGEKGEEGKGF